MELNHKKILVVGMAKTGMSVARFLKSKGAYVSIADRQNENQLRDKIKILRKDDIKIITGPHKIEDFISKDMIVLSPGVPHTIGPIKRSMEEKIPVIGEIELASCFIKEKIIAITGTNGKTTTTTLIGKMLEASGKKVFVGGNIGNPLIDYVINNEKADVLVVEVSSFQLDTIEKFRPNTALLLNITDDHLDRYKDFNEYARSKFRIFKNQKENDIGILNANCNATSLFISKVKSKIFYFNGNNEKNAIINKNKINFPFAEFSIDTNKVKLPGEHNLENISAASIAAWSVGATKQGIQKAVDDFRGLPHRMEYVATVNGIDFFNDSKATNVDAVKRAITCFSSPIHLIMGGRDKGGDYSVLKQGLKKHVKELILIGESKEIINSAFKDEIKINLEARSLDEAVEIAFKSAKKGEVVLLSPACSSFDMFESYNQRGDVFKAAIQKDSQR